MAFEIHSGLEFAGIAASAILPGQVVAVASGLDRGINPCASANLRPFGVAGAASAAQGDAIHVHAVGNVAKVTANASVGVGADVTVASGSAGRVAPIAIASGVSNWSVGQTLTSGAAGEVVSILVHPRQLGGLA